MNEAKVSQGAVIDHLAQQVARQAVDIAARDALIASLTAELAAKDEPTDEGIQLHNDPADGQGYAEAGPLSAVG